MGLFSTLKNMLGGTEKTKVKKVIDDLEIELTHLSPLRQSKEKYMDLSTFDELISYFQFIKRIHFGGWGDPLAHPQALEIIKKAKEHQPRISITTSGSTLSKDIIDQLVEIDPDKITFNLDNPPHSLDNLFDTIKYLSEERSRFLKILVDYTLSTQNIEQVPKIVELAAQLQIDELIISNITFITSPELNKLKVFEGKISQELRGNLIKQGKTKGKAEYEQIINQCEKIANQKGIYFNPKSLVAKEEVMCEYSPLNSVFVAWQGNVAPCKYLSLDDCKLFFNEQEKLFQQFIIANTNSRDFMEIWNDPQYQEFRKYYEKRVEVFNKYMEETFEDEPSMDLIFNNYQKLDQQLLENELPQICSNCYKAYSV